MSLLTDKSEYHSEHEQDRSHHYDRELQIRTHTPAYIVSFNENSGRAVVQPRTEKLHEGEFITHAQVEDVPVFPFCVGNFFFGAEPKAGDRGILLVMDREIESAKLDDGIVTPVDARLHNITDSLFLPWDFHDGASPWSLTSDKVSLIGCVLDLAKIVAAMPGGQAAADIVLKMEIALGVTP